MRRRSAPVNRGVGKVIFAGVIIGALLLLVAEFDERGGWAEWGARSCAQWLAWRCSLSPGAARERVRVARALKDMPLIRAAFARGELTYCKVRALSRVVSPEVEEQLLLLARHATGSQLEKVVRGYRGALSATLEREQHAHDRRYLRHYWDEDGSLVLRARIPADEGGLILRALEEAQARDHPTPVDPSEDSTADPAGARQPDALVSVVRAARAAGEMPRAGGEPCELVVHVDAATLAGERIHERAELEDGPALAPETVRRLGCDAALVRIVERDGQPLSVGRRTRTIPPSLRRALRARDQGCRFPGCTHRRFLHAHHIRHWARGGATDLGNLVQLCSYHHRLVHEGGFSVQLSGRRAIGFRRPDGQVIVSAPPCPQPNGLSLRQRHRARGLSLDPDTVKPLSLGDPLDYGIAVEGLCARRLARS